MAKGKIPFWVKSGDKLQDIFKSIWGFQLNVRAKQEDVEKSWGESPEALDFRIPNNAFLKYNA